MFLLNNSFDCQQYWTNGCVGKGKPHIFKYLEFPLYSTGIKQGFVSYLEQIFCYYYFSAGQFNLCKFRVYLNSEL